MFLNVLKGLYVNYLQPVIIIMAIVRKSLTITLFFIYTIYVIWHTINIFYGKMRWKYSRCHQFVLLKIGQGKNGWVEKKIYQFR